MPFLESTNLIRNQQIGLLPSIENNSKESFKKEDSNGLQMASSKSEALKSTLTKLLFQFTHLTLKLCFLECTLKEVL